MSYDQGKLRYDLLPAHAMNELALAATVGANKHGERDWERRPGLRWSMFFGAIMRHAWSWWKGEIRDRDGQHHLAAVAFSALALIEYEHTNNGTDNRPR